MFSNSDIIIQDPKSLANDEAQIEAQLKPRLADWLDAIKIHLETQRNHIEA